MTLSQLGAFVAVVDAGSFSGAARVLEMTQSGVSHAIAGLESELGIVLLRRGRNGVRPTEAGGRVLGHAREMLTRAEYMRQEASAAAGVERGRLRVGSIWSVAARLLPGILGAFHRRHPGIDIVLSEGTDQEVEQWLARGVVDVGLLALPSHAPQARELLQDALVVVLPRGHALASESSLRIEQLVDVPFIMSKAGCEPLIRAVFARFGAEPTVRYEAREVPTVLGMVEEGLGITIVPELALPTGTSRLHTVPLDPPVGRSLGVVTRAPDNTSPSVEAFLREAERWAKGGRTTEEALS